MSMIKHYLPTSLLGRSLLIIVTPVFLLQMVAALIFFENHWETVRRRLARNLAGDIAVLVETTASAPSATDGAWVQRLASYHMNIFASLEPGATLAAEGDKGSDTALRGALSEQVDRPFRIDTETLNNRIIVDVQMADGVLRMVTTRKRLFSTTTYVFVLWMVGTSMVLLIVATIFMRNQIKPILRLARAADNFGKGRDVPRFKPEGAREVRLAAAAFIAMRNRILRQIQQRTAMLAGVSHDLRTPLTRMKLQLEMMSRDDGTTDLKQDVGEMERMLDGYLTFARGEGAEKPQPSSLAVLLEEVVRQARRRGAVELQTEGELTLPVKPIAFQRMVTNLIDNALRFAERVWITARRTAAGGEVLVDDNGPGIPADRREDVFKPFFRLEGSRNPKTGGVGLGLTIARDLVHGHGGDMTLEDSPRGGLRVRIRLPQ